MAVTWDWDKEEIGKLVFNGYKVSVFFFFCRIKKIPEINDGDGSSTI